MTTGNASQATEERGKERLTALGGFAALSLAALSSVAYGPEAILVVLVTAGASALRYSLPVTVAIVVLLAALVISCRQVIEAFPNGGGAYAVSQRHLGDDDTGDTASAEASFRAKWNSWRPDVPLISLKSSHRSISDPIVAFLRSIKEEDKYHRLVVLIPEVQPSRWWRWLFHNQRGIILAHAIRRGTANVALVRLRYRLATLTSETTPPEERVAR